MVYTEILFYPITYDCQLNGYESQDLEKNFNVRMIEVNCNNFSVFFHNSLWLLRKKSLCKSDWS